jgi:hypothetical protein
LQNPSQTHGDNLNNVRCKTGRTFKEQKEEIGERINELKTNSMNKNIRDLYRGIKEFKKCKFPQYFNILKLLLSAIEYT